MYVVTMLFVLATMALAINNDSLKATYKFENNFNDSCKRSPTLMSDSTSKFVSGINGYGATGYWNSTVNVSTYKPKSYSISCWIRTSVPNIENIGILGSYINISNNNKTIRFQYSWHTDTEIITSVLKPDWNHIAITYSFDDFKIYLNGILINTSTNIIYLRTVMTSKYVITDELKLWTAEDKSAILTQADVTMLYNQRTGITSPIRPISVYSYSSPSIYNIKGQIIFNKSVNLIIKLSNNAKYTKVIYVK